MRSRMCFSFNFFCQSKTLLLTEERAAFCVSKLSASTDPNKYHPVTLASVLSKVFGTLICDDQYKSRLCCSTGDPLTPGQLHSITAEKLIRFCFASIKCSTKSDTDVCYQDCFLSSSFRLSCRGCRLPSKWTIWIRGMSRPPLSRFLQIRLSLMVPYAHPPFFFSSINSQLTALLC